MTSSGTKSSASKAIEKEAELFLQQLNKNVIEPDNTIDSNEYRNRYETLLGALKLSHSRENGLVETCQSIQSEKEATITQLKSSRRENQECESHVTALQNDLDTIKSLLQAANDREEKTKHTMDKLQEELEVLTDQIDKSEIATIKKENDAKRLANDVQHWKDQAETAANKIDAMEIEEQKLKSQMDQLQILYNDSRENNAALKEQLAERESDVRRGSEKREQLERELEVTRKKLEKKTKEFIDKEYAAAVSQSKVGTLEKQLVDAKKIIAANEQAVKEQMTKKENLVSMLDEQKNKTNKVSEELRELEIVQKKSVVERNRLESEKAKLERSLESERKAVLRHQQLVEDANASTRLSNEEVQSLKKEIDMMRKREDQLNKEIMLLKRENGLHLGKIHEKDKMVKKTGDDLRYNEQVIASLEKELSDATDAMAKQVSFTLRLEGECDGLRHQVTESRASYERIMDELKIRDNQVKDLAYTIEELETVIQEEKQKHEAIRTERNNTLKLLRDEQREVDRLENDTKNLNREINNLRSEVATRDSALVKENYDYRKEKAQKEMYADEISRLKRCMVESEESIQTFQSEVRHLGTAIRKLDDTALLQRKEYDQIIKERDILGTQLIRRNDELALLYEKIKILQSTLRRGETQYNARLDDIRLMKLKVRDLQRQLTIARGGQAGVEELNRNLIVIQKELVRERVKVKALSDELENPINVHRWRKLEGTGK
jgi:chromosome segregation ATPase